MPILWERDFVKLRVKNTLRLGLVADRMSPKSVYNFMKLFNPDKVIKMNGELHPDLLVTQRAVNSLKSALQLFCGVDGSGKSNMNFNLELICYTLFRRRFLR